MKVYKWMKDITIHYLGTDYKNLHNKNKLLTKLGKKSFRRSKNYSTKLLTTKLS